MVPEGKFSADRLGHHIYVMVVHWCQMNAAEGFEESQTSLTYQHHAFYPLKWKSIHTHRVARVIILLEVQVISKQFDK